MKGVSAFGSVVFFPGYEMIVTKPSLWTRPVFRPSEHRGQAVGNRQARANSQIPSKDSDRH